MLRSKKKEFITFLEGIYESASVIIVIHYHGLTVAHLTEIRNDLRTAGAKLKIIKNTLARIAASNLSVQAENIFNGPVAIAYSNDYVNISKAVLKCADKYQSFKLTAAIVDNKEATLENIRRLSKCIDDKSYKVDVVSLLQVPASRMVASAQAPLIKLLVLLQNYVNK